MRIAMVMCVGLLVAAGPLTLIHHAAAQMESGGQALAAAKAATEKAKTDLQQTMMQMHSMSNMPMTATEQEMMKMLQHMAATIQQLIDANQNLIIAVEHGAMRK
jgi:F420-dependent methylenetetrahydromethanopterin dehydrogenase